MTEDGCSSTHPPLPPTTEENRVRSLRLLRSRRVGPATYRRLLAEHGSAEAALDALPDIARAAGVDGYEVCPEGVVAAELKAGCAAKARLLFEGDPDYPSSLCDIADAPVAIWTKGDIGLMARPSVAIVGARNASSLGTRMAKKLAQDLGEAGFVVVSGLARGIDAAAHHGALVTGTIAACAGGVDVAYPAENAELTRSIWAEGLCISDQPVGLQPHPRHFIARNRLISGLARATIVVEAAAKSGSLHCARGALDQGRDVLAVPGHPYEGRAAGCNALIRDGATLVRSSRDVIDLIGPALCPEPELPLEAKEPAHRPPTEHPALRHSDILDRLGPDPIAEDQLIRTLGRPATAVAPVLVDLELEGKVIRQAGGLLAKAV